MIFFGLSGANLSELRVVARSNEGGHFVDPTTIANNFYGNLEKLNQNFVLLDSLHIVDTSEVAHKVLAVLEKGEIESTVVLSELPEWFIINLPGITEKIRQRNMNTR